MSLFPPPVTESNRDWIQRRFYEEAVAYSFLATQVNFLLSSELSRAALLIAAVGSAALNALIRKAYGKSAEPFATLLGYAGIGLRAQSALHEVGHAVMGRLLFEGSCQIRPTLWSAQGATHLQIQGLRQLPFPLSLQTRLGLFNAGGPIASLCTATGARVAAEAIEERHPSLSAQLRLASRIDFLTQFLHALSTLWNQAGNLGDDYVGMQRRLKVHPLVAGGIFFFQALVVEAVYFKAFRKASSDKI